MKVAVVNNAVPFISGGAEHLADALVSKLREFGHEAQLLRVPFTWEPCERIVESMLACRLLRVPEADRVIGLKFPAYYIPHENKVLWLLHQFRQAYDLWGTEYQGLPSGSAGIAIRRTVIQADNAYLPEASKIYTNSHITSARLKRFNGLDSTVLFPPLLESHHFQCSEYGDFIFYPSRVNATKRQDLLLESLRYTKTPVKLVIAGRPESPGELERLDRIIARHGLEKTARLKLEFITESEKAGLFSRALAAAYIPYDEDSYGYVTLEAFHSKKAVITCTDSGDTKILVKHGETGYVVAPDPRSLAQAMDDLYSRKDTARRMGEAGHELLGELNINWRNVIETLTA